MELNTSEVLVCFEGSVLFQMFFIFFEATIARAQETYDESNLYQSWKDSDCQLYFKRKLGKKWICSTLPSRRVMCCRITHEYRTLLLLILSSIVR